MQKYQANPITVEAAVITQVIPVLCTGGAHLTLDDGQTTTATAAMLSRYEPVPGDYWVVQDDGYEYVNPKSVFERKYSLIDEKEKPSGKR